MIVAQPGKPTKPPPGQRYLDSAASLQELVKHMPPEEQQAWEDYGHLRVEPGFQDRVFVVYAAVAKHKAPKILATVRVVSFIAKDDTGCIIRLCNDTNGREMEVTHVPKRLFDFDVFVAIPPMFQIRWDLRQHGGKLLRSLSYLIFIKTKNKSEFHSRGNTYVETPNKLKDLYPEIGLKLEL